MIYQIYLVNGFLNIIKKWNYEILFNSIKIKYLYFQYMNSKDYSMLSISNIVRRMLFLS